MNWHIRCKTTYLCAIILCILSQTVFSENTEIKDTNKEKIASQKEARLEPFSLGKEKIFERFMQNQKTKKRFQVKAQLKESMSKKLFRYRDPYLLSSSSEHLLCVDLEKRVLHSLRKEPMKDIMKMKREFCLLDQMLYKKSEGKWIKYSPFSRHAPTFWKMMELIRAGGFYDEKEIEGLKPTLDDTIFYAMTYSNHIDEEFGEAFRILFLGLNYADILDIKESNLDDTPCYLLKIKIPEAGVKKFLREFGIFTDEPFGAITPPKLIIDVFISKDDYLLLAVRYDKYETKGWTQFFHGIEKRVFTISEKITFEYPTTPLELPPEVKSADKKE